MQVDDKTPLLSIVAPASSSLSNPNCRGFRSNLAQLKPNMVPRRDKCPFLLTDHDTNLPGLDLAGNGAPGIEPVDVLIAIARVLVKDGAAPSVARIKHIR